ncbi:hypothetical protein [Amycolatopsis arida]|uniref:hypothetical protein n=1 Tax=Amycolatopsis arida TaxID=587909 RepID=UPI001066B8FF|nr:hypothetical protein [Amycolatopsis arida]
MEAGQGGLDVTGADALTAGPATFQVSTPDERSRWVGLVDLSPEVDLATFLAEMGKVFVEDPEVSVPAGQKVTNMATLRGGVSVNKTTPLGFSVHLAQGTYHLVDYSTLGEPDALDRVRTIEVGRAEGAPTGAPRVDGVVAQFGQGAEQRFLAPDTVAPDAQLLVSNATGQNNEAIIAPVKPGVTDEQVQAFFDSFGGGQPAESPFASEETYGLLPLGPGQSAVLRLNLQPGRYVLMSWVGEYETGKSNVQNGMHHVFTVA